MSTAISYREMCEVIAKYWNSKQKEKVYDPIDIWNYSSSGELFMISFWYEEAMYAMQESIA